MWIPLTVMFSQQNFRTEYATVPPSIVSAVAP